ncbi:transmembrane protein 211 [Nothoprocta perdicaria]|uniref:transmembrane protein 211 n=1 Tax=Nothoprocta perdicaria TaxID=30464 RepID=UPI000E1B5804|nr:transmembrane protein 211 [Nothoprocta perdicaria]
MAASASGGPADPQGGAMLDEGKKPGGGQEGDLNGSLLGSIFDEGKARSGPPSGAGLTGLSLQASAALCAGGCALLALGALLALVAVLLPAGACERRACALAGYVQAAAVFIMASGLLVYPFGFNSATVKRFCENSDIYYAGDCQIGWGYMLAIVGVMLSVFLPFFAKYAPKEHISPTPIPTLL